MSFKIDSKQIGIAAIILGLFLGFYVDNTIISKPRIEALTNQTLEQETIITGLQGDISLLQSEYDTLEALYSQLDENNVPLEIHQTLQDETDALSTQLGELETQIEALSTTVDELEGDFDSLTEDYNDLTVDYNKLQDRFYEIYNPGYVAFSLNGYNVNLTVSALQFEGNVPIQGSISIRKSNGAPFEGTFKLRINKVYLNLGSPSTTYEIYGESDYSWSGAFVSGAGSYKLSVAEIRDSDGVLIIPSSQLGAYYINIFMG